MKSITFAAQDFTLMPCGLLLWPYEKLAIAADLHLEKASYFAARGQMLPPHDSQETLQKLRSSLSKSGCDKLLLLGDSFHDIGGLSRMSDEARHLLHHITEHYETIWVTGNHDPVIALEGTAAQEAYHCRNIIFRHEAAPADALNQDMGEISGHYHPKCSIKRNSKKISRPCFVSNVQRLILPAFGVFTGGLDIDRPPLEDIIGSDYHAYLLGRQRVYSFAKAS